MQIRIYKIIAMKELNLLFVKENFEETIMKTKRRKERWKNLDGTKYLSDHNTDDVSATKMRIEEENDAGKEIFWGSSRGSKMKENYNWYLWRTKYYNIKMIEVDEVRV